jgi:tricorn protease
VTPVASEQQLRHYAWVTDNRAKVAKATGGKVAYIYLPDTSMGGSTRFNREFYAQVGKEGAIIDERFNGGGSLADQVIDALARTPRNYASTREGADTVFPRGIFGPKVMIINESAGLARLCAHAPPHRGWPRSARHRHSGVPLCPDRHHR